MQLPEDFKEFIALMISNNVRFVMIGGYAYNLYRNPRATGDIDFILSTDAANDARIRKVLNEFGFGSTLPSQDAPILVEGKVIMLGRSPFRIDLLTKIDGVAYDEVESTSVQFEVDGYTIPVISPQTLLKNKSATNRPKDIADSLELKKWLDSSST